MKIQTFFALLLVFILLNGCKNTSKNSSKNYYELVVSTDGASGNHTVSSDGLLAALKDSTQYGLTFSDGPNKSMIAKLHKLNYVVNESAKVLSLTNVIVDVDTLQIGTSKKVVGSDHQVFDIALTNIVLSQLNESSGCLYAGCCKLSPPPYSVYCCGACNHPSACPSCGLMEPVTYPFPAGSGSNLTFSNPDDVPTLNDFFRNYNTLTVKLK